MGEGVGQPLLLLLLHVMHLDADSSNHADK